MKVVAISSTKLALRQKPVDSWVWGSLTIIGVIIFLINGLFYEPVTVNLNCQRFSANKINCEFHHLYLIRGVEKQNFYDPQQANMIVKSRGKGGTTYQVAVSTSFGEVFPFSPGSFDQNQLITNQINDFINSQQPHLLTRNHYWGKFSESFLLGILVSLFGIYLMASPVETCTFYKSLNQVIITRNGLLCNLVNEYSLDDIFEIYTERQMGRYKMLYRPVIAFKSKKLCVPLKHVIIYRQFTNERDAINVVNSVKHFLNLS
ncbi:hypothetical protein NIES4101_38590 [Calothrix sp. NIES-4101]|nr:hypothetical protein NIES4101_38590 [Calothrix sp. NIES-4101]